MLEFNLQTEALQIPVAAEVDSKYVQFWEELCPQVKTTENVKYL